MLAPVAHWTGTIALLVIAAALATYSVQLNYQYAIWLFGSLGVGAPLLYAFGVAAADIGKLALPWLITQQWIAGRRLIAVGTTILMIGLAAASVWALVSLGLQGREGIAGAVRIHVATLADLKAARADLKAQLAAYGAVVAPDVLERQMQAMRFDKRWAATAGCTQATRHASRTFCAEHGRLFSHLAGANVRSVEHSVFFLADLGPMEEQCALQEDSRVSHRNQKGHVDAPAVCADAEVVAIGQEVAHAANNGDLLGVAPITRRACLRTSVVPGDRPHDTMQHLT